MFYKETEFQNTQTGKIPGKWQDATLSELSEHITKGTTPTTYGFGYESSGINFIKVESIDENGKFILENIPHISKEANDALSRSMLKEKDILFSIAGALGRVALVSAKILPANTNQALSIIRIKEKEKVLPEYLKYFLTGPNIQEFIKSIAIQSQQANLNLEQVRKFRVGLPSVSEQKEIVGVLGVVDSALELADRIIAKTERLKKGLMQQLLTCGIGHSEYKLTPIGKIPKEWNVDRLENLAELRSNRTVNNIEKIAFIPMELVPDKQLFAKYELRAREDVKSSTYCEAGDLLLAKITPSLENGKQGIVPLMYLTELRWLLQRFSP